jgi:hypothetical protein
LIKDPCHFFDPPIMEGEVGAVILFSFQVLIMPRCHFKKFCKSFLVILTVTISILTLPISAIFDNHYSENLKTTEKTAKSLQKQSLPIESPPHIEIEFSYRRGS